MEPPAYDPVLYECEETSLAWKLVVSAATGAAVVGFMSFLRWFARRSELGDVSAPMALLGAAVAAVMAVAALRSEVVRRVELPAGEGALVLRRDPGVTERLRLADVAGFAAEMPRGGWSRDPSPLLVVTTRDGAARRFALPDDCDTVVMAHELEEVRVAHAG